jgi:diguanylate cyclase (GGDEF)-like protein
LPNRRLLEHRLNVAMADPSFKKTGLYVLLIDLNRLQTICDELGQNAGDQVLCEVSARLQSSVRRADTVAHIKGGEFVVVLTGIPHQADAQSVANAILIKLTSSVTLGSQRLGLEVNIGAAAFPRDGDNVVSLLKHAQAALQEAKILGSHLSFYENMPLPTDKQNPTFLSVFVPAYQTQQSQLK